MINPTYSHHEVHTGSYTENPLQDIKGKVYNKEYRIDKDDKQLYECCIVQRKDIVAKEWLAVFALKNRYRPCQERRRQEYNDWEVGRDKRVHLFQHTL